MTAHPEATAARVAEIIAGLAGPPEDRWFWRGKAERRVRALDEDEPFFGLVPDEIAERALLRQHLLANPEGAGAPPSAQEAG